MKRIFAFIIFLHFQTVFAENTIIAIVNNDVISFKYLESQILESSNYDEKVIVVRYVFLVLGLHLSGDSFWDNFGDNLGTTFGTTFWTIFMDLIKKLLLLDMLSLSLVSVSQLTDDLIGSGWTFLSLINFHRKHPGQKSNYPNYFFSLGDHNSKYFFHCLSSHFGYNTFKVSQGN